MDRKGKTMWYIWISLVFLSSVQLKLEAFKILLTVPKFAHSHVTFVGRIADALVEGGFDVTVLLAQMNPLVVSNGTKLAKRVFLPFHPKILEYYQDSPTLTNHTWRPQAASLMSVIKLSRRMAHLFSLECEHILTFDEELNRLKSEKFDLAMTELFDGCSLGLIELLKIPAHVLVTALPLLENTATALGVPYFPSYVPSFYTRSTDRMSYIQRVMNLLYYFLDQYLFVAEIIDEEKKLFKRKFGDDFIDLSEKISQATFFLTNTDPFLDFPRPTIYKVIDLPGLSVQEPKPLNKYWKSVMERRQKVILVSFGTVAQSHLMPPELKQTVLHTFDQFPDVTFIWKYEKDEDNVAEGHENVVTNKWLPQNEILAHPNLIAFITHAGMNSISETAHRGKPVIAIPLLGDQMRNAKMAERAGIGIVLEQDALYNEGVLANAIATIINDKRYSVAANKLARMIAKRPNQSKEQLIKHVKFAAEFGRLPNLDPYGRQMSFITYFMLDIIIPFLVLLILICTGIVYLLYRLLIKGVQLLSDGRNKPKAE